MHVQLEANACTSFVSSNFYLTDGKSWLSSGTSSGHVAASRLNKHVAALARTDGQMKVFTLAMGLSAKQAPGYLKFLNSIFCTHQLQG